MLLFALPRLRRSRGLTSTDRDAVLQVCRQRVLRNRDRDGRVRLRVRVVTDRHLPVLVLPRADDRGTGEADSSEDRRKRK